MISIDQEDKIRTMIDKGDLDIYIEFVSGVSHQAIGRIRKMMNLVYAISQDKKMEIRRLLLSRVPIGAIEIKTKTPKSSIRAVQRFCYLQKRYYDGSIPMKCPTCGGIMPPTPRG